MEDPQQQQVQVQEPLLPPTMSTTPQDHHHHHVEEEYTDYSCSTALERLSRDVETILRAWHIDNGCDRHVSLPGGRQQRRRRQSGNPASDGATDHNHPNDNKSGNYYNDDNDDDDPSCPLIRSQAISWTLGFTNVAGERTSATIDLELALWDDPREKTVRGFGGGEGGGGGTLAEHDWNDFDHGDKYDDDDDDDDDDDYGYDYPYHPKVETSTVGETAAKARLEAPPHPTLIKSLQRKPHATTNGQVPCHDFLFDNFSYLFGIGQHLTLSLIGGPTTSTSASSAAGAIPIAMDVELWEWLATSILQRHDDQATAKFVLHSTLSQWLQTAMNCAVSNAHCGIPAFGIWGTYRPNELVPDPVVPSSQKPSSRHMAGTTAATTTSDSNMTHWSLQSPTNPRGQPPTPQSQPTPQLNGDYLLGTTIQTQLLNGNHNSTSGGAGVGGTGSHPPPSSNTHPHHLPSPPPIPSPPKGLSVFPKWAQPVLQHTTLPPVSNAYKRRAQHNFWNSHHVPPLICGRVHGTIRGNAMGISSSSSLEDIPTTGATMWISATSYLPKTGNPVLDSDDNNDENSDEKYKYNGNGELHHALAASSRLAIWASVLLSHCPPDDSSSHPSVILTGGRHVFGWFKTPPTASRSMIGLSTLTFGLFGNHNNTNASSSAPLPAAVDDWRRMNTALITMPKPDDTEFMLYKKHCQAHAMDLLEDAWSNTIHGRGRHIYHNFAGGGGMGGMEYYDFAVSNGRHHHHHHHHDGLAPIWGPVDDPVASVYATTTWSGRVSQGGKVAEPLLTFPLRIRSSRPVSKRDWMDMEESVETTFLDPLHPSRFVVQVYYDRDTLVTTLAANQRCVLAALIRSATLPGETLLHHLTDTELVELWDDDAGTVVALKMAEKAKCGHATQQIVQVLDWSSSITEYMISVEDAEAIVHLVLSGDAAAGFPSSPEEQFLNPNDLCRPFRKAAPYGRLVSLLFAHLAKLRSLSSMSLVWNVFCQELRRRWHARESLPNMQYISGLDPHPLELYQQRCFSTIGHKANFSAFLNGCEPDPDDFHCLIGQKLQVFQVGVECIVASELLEHEVMERFLEQGQVPATAKIGGKDVAPGLVASSGGDEEEDDEFDEEPYAKGQRTAKWRVVGSDKLPSKAPAPPEDPPHPSKIILTNNAGGRRRKWPKAKTNSMDVDASVPKADYGPPTINSDLEFWVMDEPGYAPRDAEGMDFAHHQTDATGFDFVMPAPPDMEDLDADDSVGHYNHRRRSSMIAGAGTLSDLRGWEGTIMQDNEEGDDENDEDEDSEGSGDSAASRTTAASLSQAYFDAAEAGSIFSMKHGFVTLDTVVNVADMKRRPGARCPVHKVTLRTGDQLYAPYLQRPAPLTDDLVLERKHMLTSEQREGESRKAVLQSRIELAHRLQRPKLFSDMSAFKAANPNSTIDDFTRWYGNPGSPLDDYDDVPMPDDISLADAYYDSAAKKLDRASEAMKILMATRDFWASTWEKAPAVPASEQQPLFDFETTVEMALDYLEQMHPANLVNQVMAVNLSSAYFALVSSAEDAIKVPLVKSTIKSLRSKLEHALRLLSDDATGALFQAASSDNASTSTATANQYISEESIYACEQACNMLSVTETMLARAVSLLSKFPSQYMLVQDLLRLTDGTTVALTDPLGRKGCLDAIYQQQRQQRHADSTDRLPKPVMREYVLRNLDDDKPCQLAVRFGDAGAYMGRVENEGGVVMAILKSYVD